LRVVVSYHLIFYRILKIWLKNLQYDKISDDKGVKHAKEKIILEQQDDKKIEADIYVEQ
jgi:hypothetical protein